MPCYETALGLAPRATLGEATGTISSRQTVNEVLTEGVLRPRPKPPLVTSLRYQAACAARGGQGGETRLGTSFAARRPHGGVAPRQRGMGRHLRESHPRLPRRGTRPGDGGEEQHEEAHQSWLRRIVGELGWLFGRR